MQSQQLLLRSITLFLLPLLSSGFNFEVLSAAYATLKWTKPTLSVCWDMPFFEYTFTSAERSTEAVRDTWEKYAGIKFDFVGRCSTFELLCQIKSDISIGIYEGDPQTKAFGKDLQNLKPGMLLNFYFANWSRDCQNRSLECIRLVAVHEFGHALGLVHEQDREDTSRNCKRQTGSKKGFENLTDYDPDSIMNYCNPKWNNNGTLSEKDIEGIRKLYPPYDCDSSPSDSGCNRQRTWGQCGDRMLDWLAGDLQR